MGCTRSSRIQQEQNELDRIGMECPICLRHITIQTACSMTCGHILHWPCLVSHFDSNLSIKKFPITCLEEGCDKQLTVMDMKQHIPNQLIEKFHKFSLTSYIQKNNDTTSCCPTAGCQAVFCIDQGQPIKIYDCPCCCKMYCMQCRTEAHPDLTCQANRKIHDAEEKEKKQFQKAAKVYRMKQCPNCKFWIEKTIGCDYMKCRCGFSFCFKCGQKFGKCGCLTYHTAV